MNTYLRDLYKLLKDYEHNENDISYWCVNLEAFDKYKSIMFELLNDEEKAISETKSMVAQQRYMLRKGIVKCILAMNCHCLPSEIYLHYDEKGKPHLLNKALRFNISHSKKYIAVIVSKEKEVGIDIQLMKAITTYPTMILSKDEIDTFTNLTGNKQIDYFWSVWTFKEAFSKFLGVGMTIDYTTIRKADNEPNLCSGMYYYEHEKQISVQVKISSFQSYKVCCVYS